MFIDKLNYLFISFLITITTESYQWAPQSIPYTHQLRP